MVIMVVMAKKTVHLDVEEETWMEFRSKCLASGTSVAQKLGSFVYEQAAGAVRVTAPESSPLNVPEIAGLVKASELPDSKTTDCRHTNALVHRGNGRYVCRKCGEVVEG